MFRTNCSSSRGPSIAPSKRSARPPRPAPACPAPPRPKARSVRSTARPPGRPVRTIHPLEATPRRARPRRLPTQPIQIAPRRRRGPRRQHIHRQLARPQFQAQESSSANHRTPPSCRPARNAIPPNARSPLPATRAATAANTSATPRRSTPRRSPRRPPPPRPSRALPVAARHRLRRSQSSGGTAQATRARARERVRPPQLLHQDRHRRILAAIPATSVPAALLVRHVDVRDAEGQRHRPRRAEARPAQQLTNASPCGKLSTVWFKYL